MVVMSRPQRRYVHLTHWGAAEIESDGRQLTSVRPWCQDPAPSRILENLATAHRHRARVDQPYIRQGWLEHGPAAAARGSDLFVPVSWERRLTCWPPSCAGCTAATARMASTGGLMAGPARAGSTMPRASCTGS